MQSSLPKHFISLYFFYPCDNFGFERRYTPNSIR